MPTINRLPIGGGASSSGAAGLNIFTQMNEPEKKDGIWIQTNNQYEKIITDARIMYSNNEIWARINNYEDNNASKFIIHNNQLYITYNVSGTGKTDLYKINDLTTMNITLINTIFDTNNKYQKISIYQFDNNTLYFFYFISGGSSSSYQLVYKYDINTNVATQINKQYWSYSNNTIISDMFMYNNDIYIAGTQPNTNGCNWHIRNLNTNQSSNAIDSSQSNYRMVVYNGQIYAFCTSGNGGYYIYNNGWSNKYTAPINYWTDGDICIFNNEIHCFTGKNGNIPHYKFNGVTWTKLNDTPFNILREDYSYTIISIVYGNDIIMRYSCAYGSPSGVFKYSLSYNEYDSNTLILQRGETGNGVHQTAFADLTKSVSGVNRFISGFDDAWFYSNGGFENCPMYYGNGSQWIRFKN